MSERTLIDRLTQPPFTYSRTSCGYITPQRSLRVVASRALCLAAILTSVGTAAGRSDAGNPLDSPPPVPTTNQPTPASPSAPIAPETASPIDTLTPYQDRPISDIRVVGVPEHDLDLVKNQIRARVGSPLAAEVVRGDVSRLTRLGRFKEIIARAAPQPDGSIALTYSCTPTPIIDDVQAVGNRQLTDNQLSGEIDLLKNTPLDEYQLGSAANRIRKLYREKGYYHASVQVEQEVVNDKVVVVFRIIEGDRVRLTDIRFEGNQAFSTRQVRSNIKTDTAGIFETGAIDEEKLDHDVAAIIAFYKDRGYLDVRADRHLIFSPNGKEAIVTFIISEGIPYTLRHVRAVAPSPSGAAPTLTNDGGEPLKVLSQEQIAGLMPLKPGDIYSLDKIRKSIDAVRNAYGRMGYADVRVSKHELRDESKPEVDLLLVIDEGREFKTGVVTIKGNDITQQKVILREMDTIRPDRPLDTSAVRTGDKYVMEAQKRLDETRLFEPGSAKITVLPERPENPGYRDVLVEIKETNTGSFNFGASVSSDAGLTGLISLNQRNFAWDDTPDSLSEFFAGRAFRGGGQVFNFSLQPGTDVQTYSISLTDPYLFDTDYSGSILGAYRSRDFDEYSEDRLTGRLSLGRRFGDRWGGNLTMRLENVKISEIDDDSPVDFFNVEGNNTLTGLGFNLTRSSIDSRYQPTQGSRLTLGIEQLGAFSGDFDFTKLSAEYQVYFPVYEDFLGRKTVLNFKSNASYIPQGQDDAPMFERYYLGGSSFRGFRYRTISPKGIRNDTLTLGEEPVGGSWSFFLGSELEHPLFKDVISVVGFIDSGTVEDDLRFDNYRVSAGFGFRFRIPFLGPAPLAFDFGFPIVKHFGDRERAFSFSVDLPF